MQKYFLLFLGVTLFICRGAFADEKYSFHENLHVGQKTPFSMSYEVKNNTTTTVGGNSTITNTTTRYDWKVTLTVLTVKDGSETRAQADFDPNSSDTTTVAGQSPKKTSCPFIGKPITLSENDDNSFSNNFTGTASDEELDSLNNFLSPDEDTYPDQPVSVGDVWDCSAKVSKHAQLGPHDQMLSQCRLDWVKTIDGKQIAHVSNSLAAIYHLPDHLEEDYEATGTFLIDLATQMIVKGDQTSTTTYKAPDKSAAKITGQTTSTFHAEVLSH